MAKRPVSPREPAWPRSRPRLLHPVTQWDALFARHFVVGVGARGFDITLGAYEHHAAPAWLARVRRLCLPTLGAYEQDLNTDAVFRPHVEPVHRGRVDSVRRPIALLGRAHRAQRALENGRGSRLPSGGRAALCDERTSAAQRRG